MSIQKYITIYKNYGVIVNILHTRHIRAQWCLIVLIINVSASNKSFYQNKTQALDTVYIYRERVFSPRQYSKCVCWLL